MRVYQECPWGCGRRVSTTRGFPMPHNRARGEPCRPPDDWAETRLAELRAAPPARTEYSAAGCGTADGRRECGGTLPPKVRAPAGWLCLQVGGENAPRRWYCSAPCLARAHHELHDLREPEPGVEPLLTPSLDLLNRVAGGERLTVMTATPERVRRKLDQAFARVVAETDAQAARDRRGRPTTAVLLAEAAGEGIATSVCTRCGHEKPLAEFYATSAAADGASGWCRECTADPGRVA